MPRAIGILILTLPLIAQAAAPRVPGSSGFTAEQQATYDRLQSAIPSLAIKGEFAGAASLASEEVGLCERILGRDHWKAHDARDTLDTYRRLAKLSPEQRLAEGRAYEITRRARTLSRASRFADAERLHREALALREKSLGTQHFRTADSYNNLAFCLHQGGKAASARPLYEKALAIHRTVYGEAHADTALGYNNLATCLTAEGRFEQALPFGVKAVESARAALGESHPWTAICLSTLARCLQEVGQTKRALEGFEKVLAIRLRVRGPEHTETATSYNNLAACLRELGRHAEAQPLFEKALALSRAGRGDDHPSTAIAGNNLALCLLVQGKASQALPLFERALVVWQTVLGPDHPYTASGHSNLAGCLNSLGKASQALPHLERALVIHRKLYGEEGAVTAATHNNLGAAYLSLGSSSKARPHHEKALSIRVKRLGEDHLLTARSYNALANCLFIQGEHHKALGLFERSLIIRRKNLASDQPELAEGINNVAHGHFGLGQVERAIPLLREALTIFRNGGVDALPEVARTQNSLALCLWQQKRRNEAILIWQASLANQEATRINLGETGFDRAEASSVHVSPQAFLAAGLARIGQPRNAFRHAETSLSRGLLDDLATPTSEDAVRVIQLQARQKQLGDKLAALSGRTDLSDTQKRLRSELLEERRTVAHSLARLASDASSRQVLPLERIQRQIPDDAALVLWLSLGRMAEHWACVVRREGAPRWCELRGSGENGAWTEGDGILDQRLYRLLIDPDSSEAERSKFLTTFRAQRLDPLKPHLKGVKRLFVVPSGILARVPAEVLTEDFSISYVPSGSMMARLTETHRPVSASSMLALGDPVFAKAPPPEPPASGVLIKSVLPGSHAARVGLQAGDILISIGSVRLESSEDFDAALTSLPATASVWREGKTFSAKLQSTPLGAVVDPRSIRAAVRAWRKETESARRGTGHKRLPGTRLEVELVSAMVRGSTKLLGSDASEQRLEELRGKGKLKGYRILHLATHGEVDENDSGRCAMILAQDDLPNPLEQARNNRKVYDGRLTVSTIRGWELDADLVVLSACETGLGKDAGGDGLLGFAQAFLSRGARSVILSRWKVDDTATSLLMIRLYENLLGKRKGAKPMGRAAALDEAKKWLRTLPRKEAERLATLHTGGVLRGSEGTEKTPDKAKQIEYKGDTPFAHPYYWAAFTLIGDPD